MYYSPRKRRFRTDSQGGDMQGRLFVSFDSKDRIRTYELRLGNTSIIYRYSDKQTDIVLDIVLSFPGFKGCITVYYILYQYIIISTVFVNAPIVKQMPAL